MVPALNQLLNKTLSAFKKRVEVVQISVFGSVASGTDDQYSDLDIEIVSENYPKTVASLPKIFKGISEYYPPLKLESQEGKIAFTVLWKDIPFYQKLDIGITSSFDKIIGTPRKDIFIRTFKKKLSPSNLIINSPFSEDNRETIDFFIGCSRYAKFRKRNSPLAVNKYKSALKAIGRNDPRSNSLMDQDMIKAMSTYLDMKLSSGIISDSSKEAVFGHEVIKFIENELLRN